MVVLRGFGFALLVSLAIGIVTGGVTVITGGILIVLWAGYIVYALRKSRS